jgi:uncharacterized protein YyaL (SSP411 family)
VDAVLARLLEARTGRPQPDIDDKRITAWNALAARGLLEAGSAIGEKAIVSQGLKTLDHLLSTAVVGDEVLRCPGDPTVDSLRLLEDHASVVAALLAAHAVAGDGAYLDRARGLHTASLDRFMSAGLLHMTGVDTELPVRPREQSDEPTPSGAATTVRNALRLHALTGDESYRRFAGDVLPTLWATAELSPLTAGETLTAMIEFLQGSAATRREGDAQSA